MKATREQVKEQAEAVERQASALSMLIGQGNMTDQEIYAAAKRIEDNAATLVAWSSL